MDNTGEPAVLSESHLRVSKPDRKVQTVQVSGANKLLVTVDLRRGLSVPERQADSSLLSSASSTEKLAHGRGKCRAAGARHEGTNDTQRVRVVALPPSPGGGMTGELRPGRDSNCEGPDLRRADPRMRPENALRALSTTAASSALRPPEHRHAAPSRRQPASQSSPARCAGLRDRQLTARTRS